MSATKIAYGIHVTNGNVICGVLSIVGETPYGGNGRILSILPSNGPGFRVFGGILLTALLSYDTAPGGNCRYFVYLPVVVSVDEVVLFPIYTFIITSKPQSKLDYFRHEAQRPADSHYITTPRVVR